VFYYAHLQSYATDLQEGQFKRQGEVIGLWVTPETQAQETITFTSRLLCSQIRSAIGTVATSIPTDPAWQVKF
jgi:hypothetical protein